MESASTIGEELDSFTILIKNCSKDANIATSETLLDFIKRLTWQENVEIDEAGPNSALAKFIDVPTDAKEVMDQLCSESFMGIMLDVVQVKKTKKLYLGNLRPNVQNFEICLYLEQPMFVPPHLHGEYQVEILHIDHHKKFALVKIPDGADIDLYLKAQHSDILGGRLHISEYQGKLKEKGYNQTKGRGGRMRDSRHKAAHNDQPVQPSLPELSSCSTPNLNCSLLPNNSPIAHETKVQGDKMCPSILKGMPFIEWIHVDDKYREKCQLMKKMLVNLRKKLTEGWKIFIDECNHRIWIGHRNELMLKGVNFEVQDILKNMSSTFLQLPKEFCMALKSSKGFSFIIKKFEEKQLKAIYYVNKQAGMIIGENRNVAMSAAELLINDFCQITCHETFTGNEPEWNNFTTTLMKNYLVYISIVVDDSKGDISVKRVLIQGFISDPNFLIAKNEVEKHLKEINFTPNKKDLNTTPNEVQHVAHKPIKQQQRSSQSLCSQKPNNFPEIGLVISMVPLVYSFFKIHFPDIIGNKRIKYINNLGLSFKRDPEIQAKIAPVELILPYLREKIVCIQIPGITEEFYNEKNSELKKEISKFELKHEFAIDLKTDKEKRTILGYVYHTKNPIASNFTDMIKEILKGFSKKKFISCDDLISSIGTTSKIMEADLIKKIMNIQHRFVQIHFDEKLNMIILQGRENFFDYVEKTVSDVSMKFLAGNAQLTNQTKVDMNHPIRYQNFPEFLKLIGHGDVYAPDHWTTFTGNLKNVSSNRGEIVPLNPDSAIFKYVSDMFNQTWKYKFVGIGSDASHLNHKDIKIMNIYSVENVFQYKRYMTRIKEFCLQNCSEFSSFCDKFGSSILTRAVAVKNEISNLLSEVNECHLFHGTRFEKKKAIIDQGFDFRLGSHCALFGQGIYFAESSTKADQYTDPKNTRSSGENLFVFVARVFLGKMHEATKPESFKRPPCQHPDCISDTCSKHAMNDSVIGTHTTALNLNTYNALRIRLKTLEDVSTNSKECVKIKKSLENVRPLLFREFVVYDHDKCFPEFLVEYTRI